MRENYKRKGERYLLEGRFTIISITPEIITATVKGAGEIYDITVTADGWRCTCMAKGPCAHIHAAQLVVLKPRRTK